MATKRSFVDIIGPNGVSAFASGNVIIGPFPENFVAGTMYVDPDTKEAVLVDSSNTVCRFFLDDQTRLATEEFNALLIREDGLGGLTL